MSHFLTFPDTFIELLTTNYKRRREFLKIRMVESQGNGGENNVDLLDLELFVEYIAS